MVPSPSWSSSNCARETAVRPACRRGSTLEQGAEAEPLLLVGDRAGRLDVGDRVVADRGRLARLQVQVVAGLEARRRRHRDEQDRDPGVHDVAAVAAAVARDHAGERRSATRRRRAPAGRRRRARTRPTSAASAKKAKANKSSAQRVVERVGEDRDRGGRDRGDGQRRAHQAPERPAADPAPGEQRPDAR